MKKETQVNEGFINESGLEFCDISSETGREYGFPNGQKLYIGQPLYLNVSKSGGHRLYTKDGWSYYIHPREGWWITWRVKDGAPNFVK